MNKLFFALCASLLVSNSCATVRQHPPLKNNNEQARLAENRRKLEILERQLELVRSQLEQNNKKYKKTIEEHLINKQEEQSH